MKTTLEQRAALRDRTNDVDDRLYGVEVEDILDDLDEVTEKLSAANMKWLDYETTYILPVFRWGKELDIDVERLVRENPGSNCVELFVATLRAKLDNTRRALRESEFSFTTIHAPALLAAEKRAVEAEREARENWSALMQWQNRVEIADSRCADLHARAARFRAALTSLRAELDDRSHGVFRDNLIASIDAALAADPGPEAGERGPCIRRDCAHHVSECVYAAKTEKEGP